MRALACLAAAPLLALVPAPVAAAPPLYLRTTTCEGDPAAGQALWWGAMPVHWRISSHHVPVGCQDLPTLEAHLTSALGRWPAATAAGGAAPCTSFAFQLDGAFDQIALGNDGANLVVFRQGTCGDLPAADPCHAASTCGSVHNCWEQSDSTVLALTWTSFDAGTGQILDADIELHDWASGGGGALEGFTFTCSNAAVPCNGNGDARAAALGCVYADVDAIATHESGHVLGLDHPCAAGQSCTPVMAPSVTLGPGALAKRTLTADDVAGVCAIYPAGAAGPWKESLPGSCTARRGCGCGGEPAPLALAILAALLWRRSRRFDGAGRPG